jgi:hypothetical protein
VSDQFDMPESFSNSSNEPNREGENFNSFSKDFQILFYEIYSEIARSIGFFARKPYHDGELRGPVLVGQAYNPLHPNDDNVSSMPLFSDNVRQWPIPGTNFLLIDTFGPLAQKVEGQAYPQAIHILNISTKAELEQLRDGLRAIRD